jgi:hypothetical protein
VLKFLNLCIKSYINLSFSSFAKMMKILFLGIGCDQEALEFFK